jgi:hypothetical protein
MFGKPQWFRPKRFGFGLTPVSWQGWLYSWAWAAVIAAPFVLLVWRHQPAEATAWLALAIGALVYDSWQIRRAIRSGSSTATVAVKQEDEVLFIGDSNPGAPIATQNYRLQVRH